MKAIPELRECFVIDKDTFKVYKMDRTQTGKPSILKQSSKIDFFKVDLSNILEAIEV